MGTGVQVVPYVRVSTEKQVEHGLSLEAQQAKWPAYAALYELDLVAVEVDAGVSAKTLQREREAASLSLRIIGARTWRHGRRTGWPAIRRSRPWSIS